MPSFCALPFIAGWFAFCTSQPNLTAGYVEGEYLKLAPVEISEIAEMKVKEGDLIKKGELIAVLVSSDANMKLAEATRSSSKPLPLSMT